MTLRFPFSLLKRRPGLAVLAAALILTACSGNGESTPPLNYTPQATEPGQGAAPTDPATEVAATVNGQPIMMESYRRELARFEAGQAAIGFEVADRGGYEQQVLDFMIENELIRQQAAQQGTAVTDEEVDAAINEMKAEVGEEYFGEWLELNYYTPEEFREVIRFQLLVNKMTEPVVNAVPVTAEHVHARHILVASQEQADEILIRLNSGEDFAALAAQYSIDVGSRERGGDLGWFPRGGLLVPEVEETAFSLQPGQTSSVIATAWGFHIIQTLEFEASREVNADTLDLLKDRAIEAWRRGLRDGADIQQLVTLTS